MLGSSYKQKISQAGVAVRFCEFDYGSLPKQLSTEEVAEGALNEKGDCQEIEIL